jgi:biopolymer transport protein ExbD
MTSLALGQKKSLFKKRHQSEDMALQITSLADIFVIILVFLLKSFATSSVNLSPTQGLILPQGTAAESAVEALKVEISETAVSVEGQPAATLANFRFAGSDVQQNGVSTALSKVLERERQRQLMIAKANSDVKVDPKILVVSDQRVPYSTVKSVLASAALNGYTDFKLAVVKGD